MIIVPIILSILALAFIFMGAYVLLKKRPLLLSARWYLVLIVMAFLPMAAMRLFMPFSSEWTMSDLLVPTMYLVLFYALWLQLQGYIVIGITDESFRKSLFAALTQQQLEWKEELSTIRIPSENLNIAVSIQSWMGTGQIKNKTKDNQAAFTRVIDGLREELAQDDVKTNNIISIFYVVMGIILFVLLSSMLSR